MKSKPIKKRLSKSQRAPDAPGNLRRCDCGTVCDLDQYSACPECGTKLEAIAGAKVAEETVRSLPTVEKRTSDVASSIKTTSNDWMWKLAKYAGIMLVAAYALRLTLDWLHSPAKVMSATQNDSSAERTTEANTPAPSVTPQARRLAVDSRLVGDWEQFIGGVRWSISIHSDGTYNFETSRPMQIPSHSGTFGATDGQWQLHAQTIAWDDSGTYQVPNPNSFVMYGKLGTGMWRRTGTQTSHLDPQPTPFRRSNHQGPAPTPNHRTRTPQRGSFAGGVFEDFAKRLKQGEEWLRR